MSDAGRICSHIEYTTVAGETVILDRNRGVYLGLDEAGSFVWKLLVNDRSLDDILAEMARQYRAPRDVLKNDLMAFIRELQAKNILDPL